MIGYKGFNPNWTCLDFQYALGQSYEIDEDQLVMCKQGFHFCRYPIDVLQYYNQPNMIYAIIKADGIVIEDIDKCVTNKITIMERITREQLMLAIPSMIQRINGNKEWYHNGLWHRDNGPAIECANGDKYWYQNGLCHRDDGPAVETVKGDKEWWSNGKRYRKDGPVIEYAAGWFQEDY